MKTLKEVIIKGLIIMSLLLVIPMTAAAMGNSEKPYPEALQAEFIRLTDLVEAGEIDAEAAIEELHDFRVDYDRENNADYRKMEQLVISMQTKVMTKAQVMEQFRLLEECEDIPEAKLQEQVKNTNRNMEQINTQSQNEIGKEQSASGGSSSGGSTKSSSSGKTKK